MEFAVVIAGFGGQGLLFAGRVLAEAALREGHEVSWMPSYGPEMRGGTASCTVIVADRPIGSPIVDLADAVIALNPPSMAKYEPVLRPGGLLVRNTSLIEADPTRDDLEVVDVPCTMLARAVGEERAASLVALGALLARRTVVSAAAAEEALARLAGSHDATLVDRDQRALAEGFAQAGTAAAPQAPPAASSSTLM
jgi:2-oxoglutarate ferredoxin oxidoreductase subunit gamma